MLKLKEVSKTYKNGVNALYNVNLFIDQGEFVYIIGPTGSGNYIEYLLYMFFRYYYKQYLHMFLTL